MVYDSRKKDSQNNRGGLFKASCEDEGEELSLVANFSKGDDPS
jgi:hypothetical protein